MANVYLIEIEQQPIELYKLLKIADLVSGGGEAKMAISQGYVLLNNEVEIQKRKKVYDGDYIQFNDDIIEVQFVENPTDNQQAIEPEIKKTEKPTPKNTRKKNTKNKSSKNESNANGKRRPLNLS